MKQTRLLVNNPREVTYADAYAIYSEALDGKRREAAVATEFPEFRGEPSWIRSTRR